MRVVCGPTHTSVWPSDYDNVLVGFPPKAVVGQLWCD